MPLLYGEGKKASTRLQEEILKDLDDHSLFAWKAAMHYSEIEAIFEELPRGILANSPAEFAGSLHVVPFRDRSHSALYSMTNKGLSIRLSIEESPSSVRNKRVCIAALNCRLGEDQTKRVGIYLMCLEGDQYARIRPSEITTTITSMYDPKPIFIRKKLLAVGFNDTVGGNVFRVILLGVMLGYDLTAGYLETRWDKEKRLLYPSNVAVGKAGVLQFQNGFGNEFWAVMGCDSYERGWCFLRKFSSQETLESVYHSFDYENMILPSNSAAVDLRSDLNEGYNKATASVTKEVMKGYTEYLVNIEMVNVLPFLWSTRRVSSRFS